MKLNKIFSASMLAAALAFVGCNKGPNIVDPGEGDIDITCPSVAAPAAGNVKLVVLAPEDTHENGIYVVGDLAGSENDWKEKNTTFKFSKIEDAAIDEEEYYGRWYEIELEYDAALALKVVAVPEDENLVGWSYQWGKNFDPDDENCEVPAGTVNVEIIEGSAEIVYENGGQPKLISIGTGATVFIAIHAWATSPILPKVPATEISFKHPWGGGSWDFKKAESVGNNTFELTDYYGAAGFDVMDESGTTHYFNVGDYELVGEAVKGDKVKVSFVSEQGAAKGTLTVTFLEKGEAVPDVPAGNGTFTVKILNRPYTEGDKCIFTGNFDENGWGASTREMTYNADKGTWSWTGDYPKNFEYKVIYYKAEAPTIQVWAAGGNVAFKGDNNYAEFNIQ